MKFKFTYTGFGTAENDFTAFMRARGIVYTTEQRPDGSYAFTVQPSAEEQEAIEDFIFPEN